METLITQFEFQDDRSLDDEGIRVLRSSGAFEQLTARRAQQAWGGPVPSHIVYYAQCQGAAIFVTNAWEVTIRSTRLLDCVGAMYAFLNAVRQGVDMPIGIELLDAKTSGDESLYKQLDTERRNRRILAVGIWLIGLIAGGLISWGIQSILG